MPSFTPVEHDPFAQETQPQPGAPKLVPVEHDPFTVTAPKPGIPMLPSHAAPTPTIGERVKGVEKWAGTETPESTGNFDWATRVVPTSIAKNVVGMGLAAKDISAEAIKNPLGGAGLAVAKQVPGLLRGAAVSMGLRPPEGETPSGPIRDYGTGLPSSLAQHEERLKHQVRTNPVGVVGTVAGIKGAGKGLAEVTKGAHPVGAALNTIPGVSPESLARSALKPYSGEVVAKQKLATRAIETFLTDKNKSASAKKFLQKNVAEMEDIGGRQNVLLDEKGHVRSNIAPIEQALQSFVDEARATPGTAESAVTAAEKVLNDIKNHPDYDADPNSPTFNTIGTAAAQTMKKNVWRYLREKGAFTKDGNPQLNDAMWSSADGMAKMVNDVIPEMAGENARYGEIANLNKLLTKSIQRIDNNNIVSLHSAMQLIRGDLKGFGMAVVMKTLDHPTFKSYLAQKMKAAQGKAPTRHQLNNKIAEIKVSLEDYDPSLRTPSGAVSDTTPMTVEGTATPESAIPTEYGMRDLSPTGLREHSLGPEFTRAAGPENIGAAPPREAAPTELQNLGGNIPKAPEVIPQPGRGATLIENKLSQGKGRAVYQSGYGGGTPKFDNTPPTVAMKPTPNYWNLVDTAKGGGVGKQFVKGGETYTVEDVMGGPEPSIRVSKVGEKGGETVPESQFQDWYNGKAVERGAAPEPFKPEVAIPKLGPSRIVDITTGDGRPAEVLVNPSALKAKKLFKMSKDKQLRYMVDKNTGDLYMWDAYDATHPEVIKQLKKSDITVDSMQGDLDTQIKNKVIASPEDIDYALKWRGKSPTDEAFMADMKAKGYAEGGMVTDSQPEAPNLAQDTTLTDGTTNTLLPSVQFKGKTYDGSINDHHADILESNKIGRHQPHGKGFVTPDGEFLSRQQATAYMKKEGYSDVPDSLHSEDLRAMLKKGKPEPPKEKLNRRKAKKEMMNES